MVQRLHLVFVPCEMANVAITVLQRVVSDLSAFVDGRDIPEDTFDSFIVSLEFVYRELIVLETTSQLTPTQHEASDIVSHHLGAYKSTKWCT